VVRTIRFLTLLECILGVLEWSNYVDASDEFVPFDGGMEGCGASIGRPASRWLRAARISRASHGASHLLRGRGKSDMVRVTQGPYSALSSFEEAPRVPVSGSLPKPPDRLTLILTRCPLFMLPGIGKLG
jgi:hypothetical protein